MITGASKGIGAGIAKSLAQKAPQWSSTTLPARQGRNPLSPPLPKHGRLTSDHSRIRYQRISEATGKEVPARNAKNTSRGMATNSSVSKRVKYRCASGDLVVIVRVLQNLFTPRFVPDPEFKSFNLRGLRAEASQNDNSEGPALVTTHGNNGMATPEGIGYSELPLLAGRAKRAT